MKQLAGNLRRLMVVIAPWLILACASPAHENTTYLGHDIKSIFVTVHSLDTYEIDGYLVDGKSLATQIKSLTKSHSLKSMIIDASPNASIFDQALGVYIGEQNGLKTYRKSLLWSQKISSAELLAEIDNRNKEGFSLLDLWDNLNNSG
ncbi:MAG: hypothetical protein COA74_08355 [Gammaproteobacteria bacterium]|nr:MAG: hypothetical protein COA74_08355 [Gammaproteobacteria bacterium]